MAAPRVARLDVLAAEPTAADAPIMGAPTTIVSPHRPASAAGDAAIKC
jgi:phosphoglycerate dehydrogenase-like enzyme